MDERAWLREGADTGPREGLAGGREREREGAVMEAIGQRISGKGDERVMMGDKSCYCQGERDRERECVGKGETPLLFDHILTVHKIS